MTDRRPLILGVLAILALLVTVPASAQVNGPFTLTANGQCTPSLPITNLGSLAIQINGSGTWTATPYVSIDGAVFTVTTVTDASDTTPAPVDNMQTAGAWTGNVGGFRSARVCLTAYTSGAPTVWISASPGGGGSAGAGGTFSGSIGDVTSNSQNIATQATLASLDGKVTAVDTGAVVVASSALPTGAATSAKQDTAQTTLSAIDTKLGGTLTVGSHAVTNAGTFAVQVSSALPAGTNAIGKLAANSGVDIGDVDVASSALPTGAATSANQSTANTALSAIQTATEAAQAVLEAAADTTTGKYEVDTNTDGASTAFGSGLAAPGSGIYLHIVGCRITNTDTSVGGYVELRDGSAGTVFDRIPIKIADASNDPAGTVVFYGESGIKLSANTALAYDASAAMTTLTIACHGYTTTN